MFGSEASISSAFCEGGKEKITKKNTRQKGIKDSVTGDKDWNCNKEDVHQILAAPLANTMDRHQSYISSNNLHMIVKDSLSNVWEVQAASKESFMKAFPRTGTTGLEEEGMYTGNKKLQWPWIWVEAEMHTSRNVWIIMRKKENSCCYKTQSMIE